MKSVKEIIVPAIVLFAICLVSTVLLGFTNKITAPQIAQLLIETEEKSRAQVLPEAENFDDGTAVTYEGNDYVYFTGTDNTGKIVGYTFTTSAKGYGGDVVIMTGVDTHGSITGIAPLELNETAGLGMNAKKDFFRQQFVGKSGIIGVSTASKKAANGIDALTGATITSKAVTGSVNLALELFDANVVGGEQ